MVASAIGTTIPLCKNLKLLDVMFTAPMGFQVIFPVLAKTFSAPSVERIDIGLDVFTSSFMQFVSAFTTLKYLHLNGLSLDKLQISAKDKQFVVPTVSDLMLSNCVVGSDSIELLSDLLPNLETVALFCSKGK